MRLTGLQKHPDLMPVRCRSCRRQIALGAGNRSPAYCDWLCAEDFPAVENEDRNSLICARAIYEKVSQTQLAADFGLTRQFVNKLINDRGQLL